MHDPETSSPTGSDPRDDFIPWDRPSPVMDSLGDFRRHRSELGAFGFVVDEPKLNARGLLHGGAIATIADACIGHTLAATTDPPMRLVTVNLNTNFVSAAQLGEWIRVTVQVHRVGRRAASGSAEFHSVSGVVAHASAVFVPVAPEVSDEQ